MINDLILSLVASTSNLGSFIWLIRCRWKKPLFYTPGSVRDKEVQENILDLLTAQLYVLLDVGHRIYSLLYVQPSQIWGACSSSVIM